MISCIYLEQHLSEHPRVQLVLKRYSHLPVIKCTHYGEIFNRKAQNFRLQKQAPALIIAEKQGKKVLPTPEGFGIGGTQNYYFSHLLNCPYDCRYCFLQGLYQSAHFVWFVNYEEIFSDIAKIIEECSAPCTFFSGYDADSLAFEPVTGFVKEIIPFFRKHANGILELRTKSTNIRSLLNETPLDNVVIAFSFTPSEHSSKIEHGVPAVNKRIVALNRLANAGWKVGLRFDPLLYTKQFESLYASLLQSVFAKLNTRQLHSVSVGPLRFPHKMYAKITKLYPEEKMLVQGLTKRGKQVSFSAKIEQHMDTFLVETLGQYVEKQLIFRCQPI